MAGVVLDDLTKRYDGGALAVDKLNLEIHDGEFVCWSGRRDAARRRRCAWWRGSRRSPRAQILIDDKVVNECRRWIATSRWCSRTTRSTRI